MPRLSVLYNGIAHETEYEGRPKLSAVLAQMGLAIAQPCAGRGYCGKCRVELTGEVSPPNELEQAAGGRLACQIELRGDCQAVLPRSQEMAQIQVEGSGQTGMLRPMPGRYGAAVDIGTTTVALRLFDLASGQCLATAARLNAQTAVAADVMGRINTALKGALGQMRDMAVDTVRALLSEACQSAGISAEEIHSLVIAGNTTMLYLLTGRSPLSLSRAPFKADHLFGEWVDFMGARAYLPPCMNAFVGADISCAVLASGMCEQDRTALLVDVGTNGEIALWHKGRLLVTSTAAGPAFEGAGIHMGCGSVVGAIDSVWLENGAIVTHTIAQAAPVGVCGSGLIDAIAVLLQLGRISDTGATAEPRLDLTQSVHLIPRDIRQVQLAKAAIASGIRTLMHVAGIVPDDIDVMYLAGGFGSHLNIGSAVRIGLIPSQLAQVVEVIGNASLTGASSLLLNADRLDDLAALAQRSIHVELGGNPLFNEYYMDEMMFPET